MARSAACGTWWRQRLMAQVDDPDDNHIDRTLIADSGTNSWRLSEHICPVAVRPTKIKLELARGARSSLAGSTDRDCDWTDMRSGNNRAGKVWLWISVYSLCVWPLPCCLEQ